MRYRKYILNNLLLPVFACLLAGLAGCSNEVVSQDEGKNPDDARRSSFSVSVRGVVTESATDASGLYEDDYVHSVRILAFDSNGDVQYNKLFEKTANGDAFQWTNDDAEKITIEEEELPLERGNYTFYFIANEKGHTLVSDDAASTATPLVAKLKDTDLTLDELRQIEVAYVAPSENTPILMTAEKGVSIISGVDVNITNVELVRTIAKVDLTIVNNSGKGLTVKAINLIGKEAESFGLTEAINFIPPTDNNSIEGKTLTLEPSTSTSTKVVSFYLSERVLADDSEKTNALKISVTVASGNKEAQYKDEIYIGPSTDESTKYTGYSIRRNTHYNITATITDWEDPLLVYLAAQPWDYTENTYMVSANGSFVMTPVDIRIHTNSVKTNKAIATTNTVGMSDADSYQAVFTLKMNTPEGTRWLGHLTNTAFEFVDDSGNRLTSVEGTGGDNENPVTIRIRANQDFDEATHAYDETLFYVTLETKPNTLQVIDVNSLTDTGQTALRIRQVTREEFGLLNTTN